MIDLHLHSNFSLDGELSPKALVDLCHDQKLKIISITDHNDCFAYSKVDAYAKEKGISLIAGIEIDCLYGDTPLHLLAYGLSPDTPDLQELCRQQRSLEVAASTRRIEAINSLGFALDMSDFDYLERPLVTAEDIAEVLLHDKDLAHHPLLQAYRSGGTRSDNPLVNFYWDYFSKGKACYQALAYPSIQSVIELIHKNGGLAILAHPAVNFSSSLESIKALIPLNIDGLEVFSSYHSSNDTDFLYKLAKEHHLLMTAGSDFHGKIKPTVAIGNIDTHDLEIDLLETLKAFLSKFNISV